jgi:hypothetical protein
MEQEAVLPLITINFGRRLITGTLEIERRHLNQNLAGNSKSQLESLFLMLEISLDKKATT